MYVTLKQLLEHAEQGGYTVLAPNVFNLESLIAVVEAAEAERAPVIIAIGESRLKRGPAPARHRRKRPLHRRRGRAHSLRGGRAGPGAVPVGGGPDPR